jgi:hypothetical protein
MFSRLVPWNLRRSSAVPPAELDGVDAMPDTRHETEADKILAELSVDTPDEQALSQGRRLLAEALERAERRGRQLSGSQKESSG